jgi:hypothetical protein
MPIKTGSRSHGCLLTYKTIRLIYKVFMYLQSKSSVWNSSLLEISRSVYFQFCLLPSFGFVSLYFQQTDCTAHAVFPFGLNCSISVRNTPSRNWVWAGRPRDRNSITGGGSVFFSQCCPTGSGVNPPSYQIGTGGSFPGGKVAETWSWQFSSD